uniref:Uncharacterized protein n=1 Tax=Acrobeloides nanus TaxID=290746 RepID=A0A914C7K3_9BILA
MGKLTTKIKEEQESYDLGDEESAKRKVKIEFEDDGYDEEPQNKKFKEEPRDDFVLDNDNISKNPYQLKNEPYEQDFDEPSTANSKSSSIKDAIGNSSVNEEILDDSAMIRIDSGEYLGWACGICGKMIKRKQDLQRHFQYIHGKKLQLDCKFCDKKFTRRDNLLEHEKKYHPAPQNADNSGEPLVIRPYICEICGGSFRFKASLRDHLKTHISARNFVCNICNLKFLRRTDLTRHNKTKKHLAAANIVTIVQTNPTVENINNVPSSSISIVEIAETKPLKLETVGDLNKEISTMLDTYAPQCSSNNASKSVEAFLHHESERIIKLENEESSMDMDQEMIFDQNLATDSENETLDEEKSTKIEDCETPIKNEMQKVLSKANLSISVEDLINMRGIKSKKLRETIGEEQYLILTKLKRRLSKRKSKHRSTLQMPSTSASSTSRDVDIKHLYTRSKNSYDLETIENFVEYFKTMRMAMVQVGTAISEYFGKSMSQTVISRFESMNLPVKNMSNLLPLLHIWLIDNNPYVEITYFIPKEDVEKARNLQYKPHFTQVQVGTAISEYFGKSMSQTVISRFESMNLPVKNMSNLLPLLHIWLIDNNPYVEITYFIPKEDVEKARNLQYKPRKVPITLDEFQRNSLYKPRKVPITLDEFQRNSLVNEFMKNRNPNNDQMYEISKQTGLDFKTVKIWFVNHRATSKKTGGIIYRKPSKPANKLTDEEICQPDIDFVDDVSDEAALKIRYETEEGDCNFNK